MRTLLLGSALAMGIASAATAQSVGGTTRFWTESQRLDLHWHGQDHASSSACNITWKTGSTTSQGVCMLANKAFAAFYKLGSDYGLIVYELQPDGSLKGYWTIADRDGVGGEILTPKR